ncbi:hypothetical protein [Streptomyces sp. NPDC003688]
MVDEVLPRVGQVVADHEVELVEPDVDGAAESPLPVDQDVLGVRSDLLLVDALEVLDTALIPVLREMVLDRYGDYVVIFDADIDAVPVFTAHGQWVGVADNPDAIAYLIDIHERVNGGDA